MHITAGELSDLLARDCERLFRELIPDCEPSRNEMRGHGPDGAVWSMVTRGHKAGVWANWGDQDRQRGDPLELVHWVLFPNERGRSESCQWAARFLGIEKQTGTSAERAERIARMRSRAAEAAAKADADLSDEAQRRLRRARGVYLQGTRGLAESPEIVDYFNTRGIPFTELPRAPRVLRFGMKWYRDDGPLVPAMVAAIVDPMTRQLRAAHCTYLRRGEDGHWRNIEGRPRRLTFGNKQGGVIPLLRGASGQRIPPAGDTLLIGEGIETTLAAALCCLDSDTLPKQPRAWAAVDLGNFASIELPPEIHEVIFVRDNDDQKFGEFRARVERRWLEQDRGVRDIKPPRGFKDFNDYIAELSRGRDAA